MLETIKQESERKMVKTLHTLEQHLGQLRAGRATPSVLDNVRVLYYGQEVPLSQVASVTVESALSLQVKPWEKSLVPAIEKAILTSDLGLNPANSGDVIRVPFPPLTEERRREFIKHVKSEGEEAKIAIRNIRRDANQEAKQALKEKLITEDQQKQAEEQIQKLTDSYIQKVDKIVAAKEKDLMDI